MRILLTEVGRMHPLSPRSADALLQQGGVVSCGRASLPAAPDRVDLPDVPADVAARMRACQEAVAAPIKWGPYLSAVGSRPPETILMDDWDPAQLALVLKHGVRALTADEFDKLERTPKKLIRLFQYTHNVGS